MASSSLACCTTTSSSSLPSPPPAKCSSPHHIPLSSPNATLPRRFALGLALSLCLTRSSPAIARDIPLFGIRKRVEKIEEAVVEEVQQLVMEGQEAAQLLQEGEKELSTVAAAAAASASASVKFNGFSPPIQAGAVVGAELLAVLIASSVVNGLAREP
eukprot:c53804_g1_i1 orf=539-1012(-)